MDDERRDRPATEPDSAEADAPEDAAGSDASAEPTQPSESTETASETSSEPDSGRAGKASNADESSEGESDESSMTDSDEDASSEGDSKSTKEATSDEEPEETLFWRLAPYFIAAAFIVELLLFGSRGDLTVCVAKKGAHDFDLIGQEKTDKNRWRFPYCESRLNIGFVSRYDEQVAEGRNAACRRATMLQYKQERNDCAAGRQHWEMRVEAKQVAPWERRFYRRLIGLE